MSHPIYKFETSSIEMSLNLKYERKKHRHKNDHKILFKTSGHSIYTYKDVLHERNRKTLLDI